MSEDILRVLTQPTVDLLLAGRVLGIGERAARNAAKAGEIPTIKVGRLYRVPTSKLREMLGLTQEAAAA